MKKLFNSLVLKLLLRSNALERLGVIRTDDHLVWNTTIVIDGRELATIEVFRNQDDVAINLWNHVDVPGTSDVLAHSLRKRV